MMVIVGRQRVDAPAVIVRMMVPVEAADAVVLDETAVAGMDTGRNVETASGRGRTVSVTDDRSGGTAIDRSGTVADRAGHRTSGSGGTAATRGRCSRRSPALRSTGYPALVSAATGRGLGTAPGGGGAGRTGRRHAAAGRRTAGRRTGRMGGGVAAAIITAAAAAGTAGGAAGAGLAAAGIGSGRTGGAGSGRAALAAVAAAAGRRAVTAGRAGSAAAI